MIQALHYDKVCEMEESVLVGGSVNYSRCAERAKSDRGKPVRIMHIGFFACFDAISLEP